ncbi:DUF2158 domain-containing protein [Aeromonas salmonicida]|uniref:DUF2158 domain-containing protein n=1 Tax=Aeromonas salmonicida TaxID=645 RepID=UPI002479472C|nr:DUF2158 domain-containing protein [Aeromonas salmonicida]ELI6441979.1 DUF2158 domain-containing protein [Aeromonas salmonicida subsp. salmonicida]ELM3711408.1 DUF2158 domain-containing protein [Aeromonas salmonicida subsp. salmonicida]ELT1967601.1 DUF2158 domain-containing protein [Aeromonas salmonicida]MDH7628934.1 DUF2158 domain-containing protein [Aeromonas salmonicida]
MTIYRFCSSGDVVTLHSGGHKMTVKSVDYAEQSPDAERVNVCCVWFNEALGGQPIEYTFQRELLNLVGDESPYARSHIRFTLGQVVKLRSGGPSMTIAGFERTGDIRGYFCVGLDEHNRDPLTCVFQADCLEAVPEA